MSILIQSNSPESEKLLNQQSAGQQFLKFLLHPQTKLGLPIKQITEVLKIQFGQIVPLPQMPPWVMGVYNWRGDILWIVDLGHLLGLDSWYQRHYPNYTAIVLSPYRHESEQRQQIHLGLVVARIEDLETIAPQQLQSTLSSPQSTELDQFLQGYWLKPDGEIILALDGQAIAAAMPTNHSN
ncbi:MAG: chemotaxis protein CheW [Cyanobacteria bacterium J06621_8]